MRKLVAIVMAGGLVLAVAPAGGAMIEEGVNGPPGHAVYDFSTGEIRVTFPDFGPDGNVCTFYMFTGEDLGNVSKPGNWPAGKQYPDWFPAMFDDSRPGWFGQADWSMLGFPNVTDHVLFLAPASIPEDQFDLVWQLKDANESLTWDGVPVEWVPEPATMALLLMGGAVVLVKRKRRSA